MFAKNQPAGQRVCVSPSAAGLLIETNRSASAFSNYVGDDRSPLWPGISIFGWNYQANGHTTTHLLQMPCADFHDEAAALAQLIAGDADKPPDPAVVLLIEQALQATYEDGWLAASMHWSRRGSTTLDDED